MVGRGMALGIDDSAHVVSRSMDSLVSTMSLSDADWSKTGRLNVTAGTGANAGDGDLRESSRPSNRCTTTSDRSSPDTRRR